MFVPNCDKNQKMRNKAVDNCAQASRFVPDWCLTSKMLKKIHDALFAYDNTTFINEDLLMSNF